MLPTFLEELIKDDTTYLIKNLEQSGKSINQKMNVLLQNFDLFIETKDISYLENECKVNVKENIQNGNQPVGRKKRKNTRRGILADITESVTVEQIRIKSEKVSDVPSSNPVVETSAHLTVENEQELGPPKQLPKLKKNQCEIDVPKRSTRTRKKTEKYGDVGQLSTMTPNIKVVNGTTVTGYLSNNQEVETKQDLNSSKCFAVENEQEQRAPKQLPKIKKNENEIFNVPKRTTRTRKKTDNYGDVGQVSTMTPNIKVVDGTTSNYVNQEVETKQDLNSSKCFPPRLTPTKKIKSKLNRSNLEKSELPKEFEEARIAETDQNISGETVYDDALSSLENKNSFLTESKPKPSLENGIKTYDNTPGLLNSTITLDNPKMVHNAMVIETYDDRSKTPQKQLDKEASTTKKGESSLQKNISRVQSNEHDPTSLLLSMNNNTFITESKRTPPLRNCLDGLLLDSTITADKPKTVYNLITEAYDGIPKTPEKPLENKSSTTKKANDYLKTKLPKKFPQTQNNERETKSKKPTSLLSKHTPKPNLIRNKNSLISSQPGSVLRCSQADAIKKREALQQSLIEERKRKREEKQLKAHQQHKELHEKEMQKFLEVQKLKEEKYKQAMAEKEEKLRRQKKESDRKLFLAKRRAEEIKNKEKMHLLQRFRLPVYMTTAPPLLPSIDYNYDEESDQGSQSKPDWSEYNNLKKQQLIMLGIGESVKNSFFCRKAQTVNLKEIFENIDTRKLKRTSSAIWTKPPRYTLFEQSCSSQVSDAEDSY